MANQADEGVDDILLPDVVFVSKLIFHVNGAVFVWM
jgi:hypothetical protein